MKITWDKYYKFLKNYDNKLYPNQRFGQAFMNEFKISNDQKLFFCEKIELSKILIQQNYIENE